jgi:hypothetical protein
MRGAGPVLETTGAPRRRTEMSEERHEGDERNEDLELDADEAERIVGGAPKVPDVSKTPPATPPGVPVPYPNTRQTSG